MEIKRVNNWREHTALLLEADPDLSMLHKYVENGETFGLYTEHGLACIAVVVPWEGATDTSYELKNIATEAAHRSKGYAGRIMDYICQQHAGRGRLYVGTADSGVAFYQRYGFQISHRVEGFFTNNYPEPIFDNGIQCVDMIYLYREL